MANHHRAFAETGVARQGETYVTSLACNVGHGQIQNQIQNQSKDQYQNQRLLQLYLPLRGA